MASEPLLPIAAAESALVMQMRPALVKFFRRRCRNLSEAEDLAQEVLARNLAAARSGDPEQLKGYVFRSAINLWRDRERRYKVQSHAEVAWDEEATQRASESVAPDRSLWSEQRLQLVQSALLELHERTRDIFILHRLEQLKYDAIAAMFGISVSAVEKHMHKALSHLTHRMEDHDNF